MKLRLSDCDYEYLRPPKDVFNVTHTDHYIQHGEGKKAVRKIFENVRYSNEELQKLKEFEALVAQENIKLPHDWTQVDNIRMMYAGKFEFKKSIKLMRQHTEWRSSTGRSVINAPAFKLLEDGILQISGRDKQYRPIILLNVHKINTKTLDPEVLIEALSFVLDVCIKYYFVPGKVENWVFVIETNDVSLINFPFKIIKTINEATSVNYTSRLDKLYIMNPSSLLNASWKMIHGFLDPETASKIFVLKKADFGKLLESISPDQLEQRYGGTLAPPKSFWPPANTLNKPPYTEQVADEGNFDVKKQNIVPQFEEFKTDTQENLRNNSNIVNGVPVTGGQWASGGQNSTLITNLNQPIQGDHFGVNPAKQYAETK